MSGVSAASWAAFSLSGRGAIAAGCAAGRLAAWGVLHQRDRRALRTTLRAPGPEQERSSMARAAGQSERSPRAALIICRALMMSPRLYDWPVPAQPLSRV